MRERQRVNYFGHVTVESKSVAFVFVRTIKSCREHSTYTWLQTLHLGSIASILVELVVIVLTELVVVVIVRVTSRDKRDLDVVFVVVVLELTHELSTQHEEVSALRVTLTAERGESTPERTPSSSSAWFTYTINFSRPSMQSGFSCCSSPSSTSGSYAYQHQQQKAQEHTAIPHNVVSSPVSQQASAATVA